MMLGINPLLLLLLGVSLLLVGFGMYVYFHLVSYLLRKDKKAFWRYASPFVVCKFLFASPIIGLVALVFAAARHHGAEEHLVMGFDSVEEQRDKAFYYGIGRAVGLRLEE